MIAPCLLLLPLEVLGLCVLGVRSGVARLSGTEGGFTLSLSVLGGLVVKTSEESCFKVWVRFLDASARALVSREALGSEVPVWWGQPLIGKSDSRVRQEGEPGEVGLEGVDNEDDEDEKEVDGDDDDDEEVRLCVD